MQLTVHVHPGASRPRALLRPDDTLEVWLRARPVEGQANDALRDALAELLRLRRREVQLVSGHRARVKRLELPLDSVEELRRRLPRERADAR